LRTPQEIGGFWRAVKWADNCRADGMPSENHERRVGRGFSDRARQCPACHSSQIAISVSTVAADYLTCRGCDHTWSVARMAASAAYRISRIVGAHRGARS